MNPKSQNSGFTQSLDRAHERSIASLENITYQLTVISLMRQSINIKRSEKRSARFSAGFTLIEVLIYTSLFMLLMSGAIFTGYRLIDSADTLTRSANHQAELNFILEKINWALEDASDIAVPTQESARITRADGSEWVIELSDEQVVLKRGGGPPLPLQSERSRATVMIFTLHPAQGSIPASLETSLTLESQ